MPLSGWKPRDADVLTALDDRKISLFRIGLALSAIFILYVDAAPNGGLLTYVALTLYTIYSGVVYAIVREKKLSWDAFVAMIAVDVISATVLVSIGSGAESGFFFLYYFPIIVAGMRGGSAFGFGVTTVSAFLFTTFATIGTPYDAIEFSRFLLRPFYLLGLGYVISLWAGAEIRLKRKLALLRELSLTTNPRLNVDRIIDDFVDRLITFYDARACVLAIANPDGESYRLYRSHRKAGKRVSESVEIRNEEECPLLEMSQFSAGIYSEREGFRLCANEDSDESDEIGGLEMRRASSQTAEWLDTHSFMTAPMRHRNKTLGQICLTGAAPRSFEEEDALFLQQIVDQIIPVLENVRLVDRLATEAAGHERGRIARSIHDRVIQPYLGLQMGLDAVRQSLRSELQETGANAVAPNLKSVELLERLSAMTREGVEELREYVGDLRRPDARRARLVDSMRRFAAQFTDVTGIEVKVVDHINEAALHDRLSAEVFQMVTEALSNVRRHTRATSVIIHLENMDNTLVMRCANDEAGEIPNRSFRPRSIADRAEALGGRTQVYSELGYTTVLVEVPL